MSYAEVASKGPKQSPEEAAAPQPPQVQINPAATTAPGAAGASSSAASTSSSLIDVDTPSVRTVPSDFASQEIQTETQAARLEREEAEARERARAEAELAAKRNKAKAKAASAREKAAAAADTARGRARQAEGWLAQRLGLDRISEGGAAGAVAAVNLLAVLGLGGWLGYRAWGLYDRGRLGWREAGIGLGLVGAVGAVEGVLASYFSKTAKGKEQ